MSEDHRPKLSPEASGSRELTASENSVRALIRSLSTTTNIIVATSDPSFIQSQTPSGFRQTLRRFKKNATKKVFKYFKHSRPQNPAAQNADHEGASSNQNIEGASGLHPPDGDKLATSENPGGYASQGPLLEEPASASKVQTATSGIEEGPDPKSVDAELRVTRERADNMRLFGTHPTSAVSAVKDGPEVLDAVDNIQTTNLPLQSLKIFDNLISDLKDIHPYAKVVLGMLSAASKIKRNTTNRCNLLDSSPVSLEDDGWMEHLSEFLPTSQSHLSPFFSTSSLPLQSLVLRKIPEPPPLDQGGKGERGDIYLDRHLGSSDPNAPPFTHFTASPAVLQAPTSTHFFVYDAGRGRLVSLTNLSASSFWSVTVLAVHGLPRASGHCFRIGRTTELLLCNMPRQRHGLPVLIFLCVFWSTLYLSVHISLDPLLAYPSCSSGIWICSLPSLLSRSPSYVFGSRLSPSSYSDVPSVGSLRILYPVVFARSS
ncbi:hypothetical protein BDR07DRAFT_1476849 [Suillus spraguei]|nr:hypothetical protein BDR07DRAFT_1476849 [Suillus spraguei]